MARKAPTKEVVRRLFALSGNQCAFSGCPHHLIDENGVLLTQICHIEAAEKGGQRYNPNQTDEERRSFENLLLLCHAHHKVTDDIAAYPVAKLQQIKAEHEAAFLQNPYTIPQEIEARILREFDALFQIAQETLEAVRENTVTLNQTSEDVGQIKEMIRAMQASQPIAVDDSKIYAQELEFIKDFRKEKKSQTALNMLLKYKKERWEKIGGELRYKVLANLGTLYFELGQKIEGAKQLAELQTVDFESADYFAYLCLGYAILSMKSEFEACFEKAKNLQADNSNLWIAFVHIQDKHVPADFIEAQIPASIRERSEILYALGEAYLDRGAEERGFELLHKSVAQSDKGIEDNWYVLSLVESKRLLHIATAQKIAFGQFSPSEMSTLKNALEVLTTVWNYVSQTELASAAWHVVLNRGITNKILGNIVAAEQDLEDAWRLSKDFFAFKDLFLHYIDIGRLDRAESLMPAGKDAIQDAEDEFDFTACQARLYSAQKRPDKAVEVLSTKIEDADKKVQLQAIDLVILTCFHCGEFGKALPYAQRFIAEFGDRPEGFLAAGVCYRMLNERETALGYLDEAMKSVGDDAHMPHIWFQLGEEYGRWNLHEKAITCFEKIANPAGFDRIHRKLLPEYYNAEEYDKAIALGLRGKAIYPDDVLINEVLLQAYHDTRQNEKAESILEDYLTSGSADNLDRFRFWGILFYNELGEEQKAEKLILQIEQPKKFGLETRLAMARQLMESEHLEQGLDMAFDARMDYYDDAKAHEMYIQCGLGKNEQPKEVLFPNEVSMNCAVYLKDQSGAQQEFFLTDDERYRGANILRSTDKLTGILLGKKRGEMIAMPSTVGAGNARAVAEIINRNVFAFRESMALATTKFSGDTGIKVLTLDGSDDMRTLHQFIHEQAIQSQQGSREVFKIYESGVVTVGMLAHHFHRNFVEMWFGIINSTDTYLRCYAEDEGLAVANAISNQQLIVIEPIALLTNLVLLPAYNLLDEFAGRCVVAQSTLTELKTYKKQLELPGPKMTVGIEEGEIVKHEHTQEGTENSIRLIEAIITWCEQNATIKAPIKRTRKTRNYEVDVVEVVGHAFHDSVLLAKELNGVLLSDDARLKSFAVGEYNVGSFSTYQIAVHKVNSQSLSLQDYSEVCNSLMRANYAFIPVSGAGLWGLFDESGFRIKPPFTRAVRGLRVLSVAYCAKTLADFAKLLYLNISVSSLREQTMLYVLQEAKSNADYALVKLLLSRVIEQLFRLMPEQKDELISLID